MNDEVVLQGVGSGVQLKVDAGVQVAVSGHGVARHPRAPACRVAAEEIVAVAWLLRLADGCRRRSGEKHLVGVHGRAAAGAGGGVALGGAQGHREAVVLKEEGGIVELRLVAHTAVPLAVVAYKDHLRADAEGVALVAPQGLQRHKHQQGYYGDFFCHQTAFCVFCICLFFSVVYV